ncbi:hypothetical protein ASPACDRAFT_44622 [Aspergillus aculeatus ATCC 16872]|uniref:FTP domain-containing protein n=1 Tax=Aspergillus aculeatus (strain ATCC 16872 / CBS 172.66 / WB 5094) TaxID=690307 RepID=A0A1L9WRY4_ASPA1|nr:uncharacterized protein ASPACDRAFT_44622 [Aspergillus aculeatus ATCC 16872]OJJ98993.1 hypothetical protein ASPACDRAFT_44622 [Aspergillus aculeatus ATCC 16872]
MLFDEIPEVEVARTPGGALQSVDHAQQPWSPKSEGQAVAALSTPQSVAEQYLKEVASEYKINSDVNSLTAPDFDLKFEQERPRFRSRAVIYQQTFKDWPVWGAQLSVTVRDGDNRVINSSSTLHTDASGPRLPPDDAKFLQNSVTEDDIAASLHVPVGGDGISFSKEFKQKTEEQKKEKQRILVYRYSAEGRQEQAGDSPPILAFEEVPEKIEDGKYYVVREVLFSLPVSGYGKLNWRAFVEVETGSIIYLQALTAGLTGWVFSRDPVTKLGHRGPLPAGNVVDLNLLRDRVLLPDTMTSSPQSLKGRFAAIEDFSLPIKVPPTTTTGEFKDSVESDTFAAVSAYYHITKLFRLLGELGFSVKDFFDDTKLPVPVDHRGFKDAVNAQAPGNATGTGSGGFIFGRADPNSRVGIAADFRVAAHEFGHALLWDAIHWPGFGFAHSPGDSLAAIYSDPGSDAQDRFDTFPWSTVVRRRHDRKVTDGWAWDGPRYIEDDWSYYQREQVLSTTLFRLYGAIGGDAIGDINRQIWASRYTLYLILGGIAGINTRMPMPDQYVSAMIAADDRTVLGHPGGAVRKVIRWAFEKQGLYQLPDTPRPIMSEGLPPAVDVYIDDGRNGEYDYTLLSDNTPGIWNRQAADGGRVNQSPRPGEQNFIYVIVKTRGTGPANNVRVTLYQSNSPTATLWPSHFDVRGTQNLAGPLSGDEQHTFGPFAWVPDQNPSFDRDCLLAAVSADGDLPNTDRSTGLACAVGPTDIDNLVPFDNNLAVRYLTRP